MTSDLFASGQIYLIRNPINGNSGINSILGKILSKEWDVDLDLNNPKEIYVVIPTKNKKTILIFHYDIYGADICKRILHSRKFRIQLEDTRQPIMITRGQLKRLIIDGTYTGEWEHKELESIMKDFISAKDLPQCARLDDAVNI